MNITELRAIGGFVQSEPVKVPVVWKDNEFDVYVRRLAFADVERLMSSGNSSVELIASSILLGDEHKPMTKDEAEQLEVSLASKLLEAVNTVNAPKP